MKRLLAALTLALLLSLLAVSGAVAAPGTGGNNDSASGTVTQFGVQETFSATSSSLGTDARGHYRLIQANQDPNSVITGEIRCLRVTTSTVPGVGALFEARGVVVDARNTGGPFGAQGFVLRGSDPGKFSASPDTYASFFTSLPQLENSCIFPSSGSIVEDGEIVVKDAV